MASIVFNEPLDQYVVEVPDKGFVTFDHPHTGVRLTPDSDKACVDNIEDAVDILGRIYNAYDRLGIGVVGKTSRILRRTITLTRSDWEKLADPKTPESSSGTTE